MRDDFSALQVRIAERLRFVNGHADNWRLFDDAQLFVAVVDALIEPFRGRAITKVAAIEARGFIIGGACAMRLGVGFAAIRKREGLFPGAKLTVPAAPDYRGNSHTLRIQTASLGEGDRVLLVDDWCETGSQALAARTLIEAAGAQFAGLACIVDQSARGVADRLGVYHWLIRAGDLRADDASSFP
jgi:adenine phosphoribosyltransferase